MPEPPLALVAVTATCTTMTKKKKRCRNQPKKGSTNGLCSVHQPSPEPASSSSEEILDESESSDSEREWCEVGEHWVDPEDMWADFADCQGCVSEKEYLEYMDDGTDVCDPAIFDGITAKELCVFLTRVWFLDRLYLRACAMRDRPTACQGQPRP